MAINRTIGICIILLEIAVAYSTPTNDAYTIWKLPEISFADGQKSEGASGESVSINKSADGTRGIRGFSESNADAATRSELDEADKTILADEIERGGTFGNDHYEEAWSLAYEMMEQLIKEDAMASKEPSETSRTEDSRAWERLAVRRHAQREATRRYRERRKAAGLPSPEEAEKLRKRHCEIQRRYKQRQKASGLLRNPEMAANVSEPEMTKARWVERGYDKRYRERQKAAELQNPELAKARRDKRREYMKRYREGQKAARLRDPEVAG